VTLKGGFGRLGTLGEAFDILYAHLPAPGTEVVDVADCLGRVLAHDAVASVDVPHFARAAMDGYAVRAEDTFGASDAATCVLEVVGSVLPGQIPETAVGEGRCVEIGTGAALPEGCDAVVMVEYTEQLGDGKVQVRKGVAPRENLVEVGSDVSSGATVLEKGCLLEPRHLGVLAAVGISKVEVFRRLRAALYSTGPELIASGGSLEAGKVFDINYHTLRAALVSDSCEVVEGGIIPDTPDDLDAAIARALGEADFMLLSGGSSLGGGDLVDAAFERAGRMLMHGVAVKPGKPLVLGIAAGASLEGGEEVSKMLIGLPGYPMSALSDYYIFVQSFVRRALGVERRPAFTEAVLSRKHPSTVGRYEFLPVRLEGDQAIPLTKGSSAISALADADGFVEIDENTEVVDGGSRVRVRLF
jgi:molybdenum cofactor synthesis domain-containing protein